MKRHRLSLLFGVKGSRDPPEFPLLFLRSVFKVTLSLRSRKGGSWPRNHTYRSRGKREEEGSIEWRVARSMILRISVLPETKLYVQGQWIATDRENGGNVIINQTRVQNEKKFGK